MSRKIKIAGVAVVASSFAGAIFYALGAGRSAPTDLPNPNGFDDLVAAARVAGYPLIMGTRRLQN
jgi:hypothetical protein